MTLCLMQLDREHLVVDEASGYDMPSATSVECHSERVIDDIPITGRRELPCLGGRCGDRSGHGGEGDEQHHDAAANSDHLLVLRLREAHRRGRTNAPA